MSGASRQRPLLYFRPMRFQAMVVVSCVSIALSACSSPSASSEPVDVTEAVFPTHGTPEAVFPPADKPTANQQPHWPFTGLPASKRLPQRRVMIVKVDNTPDAEPQVGLGSADLVIEELVEGGFTRLAAFFYSAIPETVGPVRSVRTSDIGFVPPVNALLVASGGAPQPLRRLQQAGIHTGFAGIHTGFPNILPGFFRASDRVAVHDLLLHPRQATGSLKSTKVPTDYLPWATDKEAAFDGQLVNRLAAVFSPAHTTQWRYQPRSGWIRANGLEDPHDRFTPDNIVVLNVRIQQAPYVDPSGAAVPETILVGSGRAVVIHDNHAVFGRWKKKSRAGGFRLVDRHGDRLSVPPGTTAIELVPNSGSVQLHR